MLLDILDARCRGHDVDSSKVTEFERGLTLSAAFATPDVVTDTHHLHVLGQGIVPSRLLTLQLSVDSTLYDAVSLELGLSITCLYG